MWQLYKFLVIKIMAMHDKNVHICSSPSFLAAKTGELRIKAPVAPLKDKIFSSFAWMAALRPGVNNLSTREKVSFQDESCFSTVILSSETNHLSICKQVIYPYPNKKLSNQQKISFQDVSCFFNRFSLVWDKSFFDFLTNNLSVFKQIIQGVRKIPLQDKFWSFNS